MMIIKKNKIVLGGFFVLCMFFVVNTAQATTENSFNIHLDKQTIARGYTVTAFGDALKLSLVPGVLSSSTGISVVDLSKEPLEFPWQLNKVSKVYQFEFDNKLAYDDHKPFYIQFSYDEDNTNYKKVYFYDKNFAGWRPLPTKDFPEEKFVRSLIHLPFARIAVFSYPDVMTVGRSSWYGYKGGDFAASPDFPKGSRLRVINSNNGKFVDVKVNDFGPDRSLFPDRVIDLDKMAFEKIASLGAGVIDVKIEPIYIAPEDGKVLGISELGENNEVETVVKSAMVMREDDGAVLWDKNATTTLPLASLTKLVFASVFMDTNPNFEEIVKYSTKDEGHNYQYVDHKWEVARLKVANGDTLTIKDLFYSALVGSANNAVETLVRVSGMSRETFIDKMNEKVVKWGASSTLFIEPTGLSPENVTSALDYAIISREVLKNNTIQKVSVSPQYEFYTINTNKHHRLHNTDKIIKTNKYLISGSKTGYLNEAGYCLMTRVNSEDGNVIVVTLGAKNRFTSFSETEKLMDFGLRKITNLNS